MMDEQEVERQLAIWREEMRQEREKRLASSVAAPQQTPKRAAPEPTNPARPPQSRLSLYKSELDETTAQVPLVKLSRYTRPHVDPRDVDFFEARSVLRDYIRRPLRSTKITQGADGSSAAPRSATRPHSAVRHPREPHSSPQSSKPPSKMALNRSALLRMQATQYSLQEYHSAHQEEIAKCQSRSLEEHVKSRPHTSKHALVAAQQAPSKPFRTAPPVVASYSFTDQGAEGSSRWVPSSHVKSSVTGTHPFSRKTESTTTAKWRTVDDALSSASRHTTHADVVVSPRQITKEFPRSQGYQRFTSGLQLRYGNSASSLAQPDRDNTPRDSTSVKWSANATGMSVSPRPNVTREQVSISTAWRPPQMSMVNVNRDDLFQGTATTR